MCNQCLNTNEFTFFLLFSSTLCPFSFSTDNTPHLTRPAASFLTRAWQRCLSAHVQCVHAQEGLGWGQSINAPWHNGWSSEPTVNISPRLLSHGEHEVSYYRHAIGFPQDAVKMPKGKREEGGQLGSVSARGGVYLFFLKPRSVILLLFFIFLVKPSKHVS